MRSVLSRRPFSYLLITCIILTTLWYKLYKEETSFSSESYNYRAFLSTIRPTDIEFHSKTLGVASKIYVLNIARRKDRRDGMEKLARAMDLEFTYFNGSDLEDKEVQTKMIQVLERVRLWRSAHRVDKTVPNKDPEPVVFTWADDVGRGDDLGAGILKGAELWTEEPLPDTTLSKPDTPPAPVLDLYEEDGKHFGTNPLRPAQLSCWNSHYRLIADGPDETAIVFEDDIDMEWDLSTRLRMMWSALSDVNWDIVMLGHCHSQEWFHPPLKGSPFLHPSKHVLCLHAYAVSRAGARKMIRYLRSEAFAYSRTIDHAVQHLQSRGKINSYSVYPPVVVQTYDMGSDIIPGRTNKDRSQWLQDSTLERICTGNSHGYLQIIYDVYFEGSWTHRFFENLGLVYIT